MTVDQLDQLGAAERVLPSEVRRLVAIVGGLAVVGLVGTAIAGNWANLAIWAPLSAFFVLSLHRGAPLARDALLLGAGVGVLFIPIGVFSAIAGVASFEVFGVGSESPWVSGAFAVAYGLACVCLLVLALRPVVRDYFADDLS